MARYWKAFQTKDDRKKWEAEQREKDPTFKVCMHYSARDLEKDLCMPKGQLEPNKFCTVYGYTDTL